MSAAGTKRRKVDLDGIAERFQALKLVQAAQCLAELLEEASREDLSPVHFLDRVLQQEIERKDERRVTTSLKLSGLLPGKTLEGFDWTFQPRADRGKLDALATCAFIRQTENVLFKGPPGVGKSHLAVALGVKAIKNRFSTQHYILTSNKHVRDWPEIFAGDEIPTTAIFERLLHHVHIIHIDGRSYHLRIRPWPCPAQGRTLGGMGTATPPRST